MSRISSVIDWKRMQHCFLYMLHLISGIMTATAIMAATIQGNVNFYFPWQHPCEQFKISLGYQVQYIEQRMPHHSLYIHLICILLFILRTATALVWMVQYMYIYIIFSLTIPIWWIKTKFGLSGLIYWTIKCNTIFLYIYIICISSNMIITVIRILHYMLMYIFIFPWQHASGKI